MKKLLLSTLLFMACLPPLPPPGPIPPPPSTSATDDFTSYTADCSLQIVVDQSPKAATIVPACLDANHGVDECLVDMIKYFTVDTIACVVVSRNVTLQRLVSKGVASDDQQNAARNANTWIRNHQLGARR